MSISIRIVLVYAVLLLVLSFKGFYFYLQCLNMCEHIKADGSILWSRQGQNETQMLLNLFWKLVCHSVYWLLCLLWFHWQKIHKEKLFFLCRCVFLSGCILQNYAVKWLTSSLSCFIITVNYMYIMLLKKYTTVTVSFRKYF